jgi:hypothetical protein
MTDQKSGQNTNTEPLVEYVHAKSDQQTFVVELVTDAVEIKGHVAAGGRKTAIQRFVADVAGCQIDDLEAGSTISVNFTIGTLPVQATIDTNEIVAYPYEEQVN